MSDWRGAFIAVDWGTTNCRAYRIGEDGAVQATIDNAPGILAIANADFTGRVDAMRAELGDLPVLLAGMIGSNRGWIEVPYVAAPCALCDLVAGLHRVDARTAIVPGVSMADQLRCDIMRGEEVQVFGAAALGAVADGARICHPGTHAKWIDLAGGRITAFRTAMTGEVFALLKRDGVLAADLQAPVVPGSAFDAGIDLAIGGEPLLDALFAVRSHVVLEKLDRADAASFASGVLIGSDVVAHTRPGDRVAIVGRPDLASLYAAALARRGCGSGSTDGAEAFVAGMIAIRNQLR